MTIPRLKNRLSSLAQAVLPALCSPRGVSFCTAGEDAASSVMHAVSRISMAGTVLGALLELG